ncbi:MAG: cytochrome c biogenesis protein CcsA [Deltaproteobacteria bacterium]|nr:cytochrome c biogenesis protein CcsA [Deltaproteobacteria bacterium]MBW2445036.1 cytochrome c biogenesis protein CcsA [Deltaproteobacteria bacterium]
MLIGLHQFAAALYLAAGVAGGVALAQRGGRARQVALLLLSAGAVVHLASFAFLHQSVPTPQLTDLPTATSLMACLAMLFYLAFARRARWNALVLAMAPVGFLGAFVGALRLPHAAGEGALAAGAWSHAHVLLASAGLGLLALASVAGVAFLREASRLKYKGRPQLSQLPALETLDRVNLVALSVGFPLLTLGMLTGMFWLQGEAGHVWSGSPHEIWMTLAWAIYGALLLARFAAHQSARNAALSAIGGFAFLLFAVIGIGLTA